ncbi:MAG: acyl-CoA thioesterase [Candidatus Heimdallarchaeota archaeon]
MTGIEIPEKHFLTHFKPRFRDTDRVGHVNNAVYATYVEIARVDWWTNVKKRNNGNPMSFILGRLEIDYLVAINLGDELSIAMWVSRFGSKSWDFTFLIFNENKTILHAKAKTVQVGYDYNEDKTVVINEITRRYLNEIYNE